MSKTWMRHVDTSHIEPCNIEVMSTPPFEEIKQMNLSPWNFYKKHPEKIMRTFESGATRDNDDDKLDFEGFLSPLVLRRYAEYLHKHRTQADGKMRASDNWQKGIPLSTYMKSMWRHFMDLWTWHRNPPKEEILNDCLKEEALCAIIFNASGYLHELLKAKGK